MVHQNPEGYTHGGTLGSLASHFVETWLYWMRHMEMDKHESILSHLNNSLRHICSYMTGCTTLKFCPFSFSPPSILVPIYWCFPSLGGSLYIGQGPSFTNSIGLVLTLLYSFLFLSVVILRCPFTFVPTWI